MNSAEAAEEGPNDSDTDAFFKTGRIIPKAVFNPNTTCIRLAGLNPCFPLYAIVHDKGCGVVTLCISPGSSRTTELNHCLSHC